MRKVYLLCFVVLLAVLFIFSSSSKLQDVRPRPNLQNPKAAAALKPEVDFGKIPLYFITNKGQVNAKAHFYAKASQYTLWLTKEGLVFDSSRIQNKKRNQIRKENQEREKDRDRNPFLLDLNGGAPVGRGELEPTKLSRDVSRLMFIGANKNPEISAIEPAKLKVNYLKGNDRSKWVAAPTSMAVIYKNLYKNIDLKVYGIKKQIEYDWIVKPGANPANIRFEYKSTKGTRIDKEGNLVIETEFGELMHKKPVSYQTVNGNYKLQKPNHKQNTSSKSQITNKTGALAALSHHRAGILETDHVEVKFKKYGKNIYGFEVGDYDKNRELIIDPVVLAYSTYLGGGSADFGYGIAVDNSGYVYVTGKTSSTDFPTLDRYQGYQGGSDVFVAKLDTTLSGAASLLYSTHLGGTSSDYGRGIAVDGSGSAYVTGYTHSTDFPILNQYQADPGNPNADAFVARLDTTQSGAASLLYSTYLSGDSYDYGYGIAVDAAGNAYVVGGTNSTDFPTLNRYQGDQGSMDAFVARLDTTQSGASSLLYSTYLGGGSLDNGCGIAVDGSGYTYVTGYTDSTNFPTLDRYQADQGGRDVFVTKLDPTQSGASSLVYSTYLGGGISDSGGDIAVDAAGYVYVAGETFSTDFPTLDRYQGDQGGGDAFVTKLDTTQSGASGLLYSTYLGGGSLDIGYGIAVDGSGCAYVTGFTGSTDFPTLDRYQADPGDSSYDVFVTKLDTTRSGAACLLYSTYLGGGHFDYGYGIAVDGSGSAYMTGYTYSTDFPILNQFQGDQGDSDYDVVVTKLSYTLPGSITVTSPNGGENWQTGSIQNITWASTGTVGNVRIEYSTNNGAGWTEIIASTANDGSHPWTIPGTVSSQCLVRVSETDGSPTDTSDAVFSITGIVVTSPNGGEILDEGKIVDITWDALGTTGQFKITLWQNGSKVGNIRLVNDPNARSYSWRVGEYIDGTAIPGTGYTIMVKETDVWVSDESDASFEIKKFKGLTSPDGGENLLIGTTWDITWNLPDSFSGQVGIILLKDDVKVGDIALITDPTARSYSWTIGDYIGGTAAAGTGYKIKIKIIGTETSDVSDSAFDLTN